MVVEQFDNCPTTLEKQRITLYAIEATITSGVTVGSAKHQKQIRIET
jgi:hypothetical protein